MIKKIFTIFCILLMAVCFFSEASIFDVACEINFKGLDNLSVPSATTPIAIVKKRKGEFIVLNDNTSKNKLTKELGRQWGLIYLNRFFAQILRDFNGEVSQQELRQICKVHFKEHTFMHIDWDNIYKINKSFYVKYSYESDSGEVQKLIMEYLYDKKSSEILINIFYDTESFNNLILKNEKVKGLTPEEKKKANKIYREMSETINKGVYDSGSKIINESIKNMFIENDPFEEYWRLLNEININNPIFNPEHFAEGYAKSYPEVTDESLRVLKYICELFSQEEYADMFQKVYIRYINRVKEIEPKDVQFKQYLSQLQFVPEMSKISIAEKSLAIMEYLNEELDFVDPVEFRNLIEGAKIMTDMAKEGRRFDEKKGDFIKLISKLSSIVMEAENFLELDNNYRLADCVSSGRPKIFPPGAIPIGSCDMAVFEVVKKDVSFTETIQLNEILANILGKGFLNIEVQDFKNKNIVKIMQKCIAKFGEYKRDGKKYDRDIYLLISYFLGKKSIPEKDMVNKSISKLMDYVINDEKVKSILERYFKESLNNDTEVMDKVLEVKLKKIKVDKVYIINVMMEMLEKRIMSEDFKKQHPILKASEIYLYIIDIHPFSDGNERVARLFMNYYLIVNGLPAFEVYPNNRKNFVETVRFVNDKKKFAMFLTEQLMKQNSFMLSGSDIFNRIVNPESTIKDHLDIFLDKYGVYEDLGKEIKKVVSSRKNPIIMTSYGLTLKNFYSNILIKRAWLNNKDDRFIDLSGVTFVLTDEFVGTKHRFNDFMASFINKLPEKNRPQKVISFKGEKTVINFSDNDLDKLIYKFNKELKEMAPIDLAITSIGVNGHIGYNEMGSSFSSGGRIVGLHKSTIEHRSLGYARAFTVGISDILKADRIITIGVADDKNTFSGSSKGNMLKTDAINKAIFTFDVTASFIRLKKNSNFKFILDSDTAGRDLTWIKFRQDFNDEKFYDIKWQGLNRDSELKEEEERCLSYYREGAKDFHNYFLTIPYASEMDNKNMIIGIDTGWIPEVKWIRSVINQLARIESNDVKIFIGRGNNLAVTLLRSANKRGLDHTKIVVLGNYTEYKNNAYNVLMGKDIQEKTFMALMDGENLEGLSNSGKLSYIMLMKWIKSIVKMAFSDNPASIDIPGLERAPSQLKQGVWMMVPNANLMEIGLLTKVYKLEKDVLKNL